jgi:RNA polymerase sigma-54 factor
MALELKQTVKIGLNQQLVMTPQLQQAIKLLQLSQLELLDAVQQELTDNPLLEEVPEEDSGGDVGETPVEASAEVAAGEGEVGEIELPGAAEDRAEAAGEEPPSEPSSEEVLNDVEWDSLADWESYMEPRPQASIAQVDPERPLPEDSTSPAESLADHLLWQLSFSDFTVQERSVAIAIIGNLNENGYLQESIEAIGAASGMEPEVAEALLRRVQEFDPVGVAARDLGECLRVQARVGGVTDPLVLAILDSHLELLQRRDFRAIARLSGATVEEVSAAADAIASFEPRPGRQFSAEDPIYITPDIYVHKVGDEYHVVLNEEGLPRLRVSSAYRDVLSRRDSEPRETREYVRERLRSAMWVIRSIHQRERTIVKVMESIIRFQRDFFDQGSQALRPLNLRDVAEDIGMHESTVSRVTSNKYAQTPHGLFRLKFFFNSSIQTSDGDAIASESVKEKIRELIAAEDARRPLSDQRISELLKAKSIRIARRTVTKYREAMGILSSTSRKRFG